MVHKLHHDFPSKHTHPDPLFVLWTIETVEVGLPLPWNGEAKRTSVGYLVATPPCSRVGSNTYMIAVTPHEWQWPHTDSNNNNSAATILVIATRSNSNSMYLSIQALMGSFQHSSKVTDTETCIWTEQTNQNRPIRTDQSEHLNRSRPWILLCHYC